MLWGAYSRAKKLVFPSIFILPIKIALSGEYHEFKNISDFYKKSITILQFEGYEVEKKAIVFGCLTSIIEQLKESELLDLIRHHPELDPRKEKNRGYE